MCVLSTLIMAIPILKFVALLLLCYVLFELVLIMKTSRKILNRMDTLTDVSKWWTALRGLKWISRCKSKFKR
ncbi:MAG: hypothetical protein EXS67_05870 [Candidatus Margulisbacteria bacterium]|nr:hypothetical protein [Candidatus Margulisiibacteriota bacterium]